MTPAQKNYAVIETECLAVQWAIQKCDYFLRGLNGFTVVTDHKPLEGLFRKELADEQNARLLRMRMKLTCYDFTVTWRAGKHHELADALSRYPRPEFAPQCPDVEMNESDMEGAVNYCRSARPQGPFCSRIREEAQKDANYQLVIEKFREGKAPEAGHPAHAFKKLWDRISIMGKLGQRLLVLDGTKIIVPGISRERLIKLLHASHSGITKTMSLASSLYYWPGMTNEITQFIKNCNQCTEMQPSQQLEPRVETEKPFAPMSHVGVDLFELNGHQWLLMVDRFSGWPWATRLTSTTTATITKVLAGWFDDYGWASVIRSDGGPQFRSLFSSFCSHNSIKHELASAYNPRSNGLAESNVKAVKHLLIKTSGSGMTLNGTLAAYRNTPRADGYSPAQLMFGRRLKGPLPMLESHLLVDPDNFHEGREARVRTEEAAKDTFNKSAKELCKLEVGDFAILQKLIPTAKSGTHT